MMVKYFLCCMLYRRSATFFPKGSYYNQMCVCTQSPLLTPSLHSSHSLRAMYSSAGNLPLLLKIPVRIVV